LIAALAIPAIINQFRRNLKKLTEVFGVDWARQTIIPKVMAMGNQTNYLYRMTTCTAITTLAPAVNIEVIQEYILPMINQLIDDRIPNIRFNVAKSYGVLIDVLRQLPAEGTLTGMKPEDAPSAPSPVASELIQKQILPNLEKLQGDSDRDVRYFASQALANAGDFMQTS